MVMSLIAHPDFAKTDLTSLKDIVMSGTTITTENHRMCKEDLKGERVLEGFGMSETGVAWRGTPETISKGKYPFVGANLRICDPETGATLLRGEPGMLHQGGTSVIHHYWLSEEQDEDLQLCFCDDKQGHWIKTGDRAVMSTNGNVQIAGRYKDLIIRGGENIAPKAIEPYLSGLGITAEVVGVPDEVSGEMPVAVIKKKPGQDIDVLDTREKVGKELGNAFAPEEVISLEDLGASDFPRTGTGKVQKNVLRDEVVKFMEIQQDDVNDDNHGDTETLLKLWKQILGVNKLTVQSNVRDYADSLVLSRFSARLRRRTGQNLSLQQILDNPVIEAQAKLLRSSVSLSVEKDEYTDLTTLHDGPPEIQHIAPAMSDSEAYEQIKLDTQDVLRPLGLSWNDVEDIIPMHDTMERFLKRRRPQSNNHRHAWLCRNRSVPEVEAAIKTAFNHHPILRSMAIRSRSKQASPMHVVIRPTNKFFSHSIKLVDPVRNSKALDSLEYNNLDIDYAADPGPMFRIIIVEVQEEKCAGIVYMAQHSVFDGVSLPLWTEDLDLVLNEPDAKVAAHIPYKAWADHYYNHRDSAPARQAIAWNFSRLSGISKQTNALFPFSRAPEMFKGNTKGWIDLSIGKPSPERKSLDDFDGLRGIVQQAKIRDVQKLKSTGIEVPQLIETALAIMNSRQTMADVALFGQYQAARTWPFLAKWQSARLPGAMDINGPNLELVVVRASVYQKRTVIDTMRALQEEEVLLNENAHAPYYDLLRELREDGAVVEEVLRRQIFNWLPGGAPEHKCLELVSKLSRTDVGILWNCTMKGDEV